MAKISFIYFDVGGVAIKDFSDTNKWEVMIKFLGVPEQNKQLFIDLYKKSDDKICLELPIDEWLRRIADQVGITVKPDFSFLNYFIDNFSPNPDLWELIKPYQSKFKMGLLTDQYPDMLKKIFNAKLIPDLKWSAIIDSTVEKVRKPMPEIYQLAQVRAGVPANEILFIDNREKNLVPARELGWSTFLYDSRDYERANQELEEYLKINF